MAEDWSREEVEATVATYLEMLERELLDQPFSKTDHNRALQPLLNNRSKGAVEFKFGNVSAALVDLGMPYVDGYKPYPNYQQLLLEVTAAHLEARPQLLALIETTVNRPAAGVPSVAVEDVLVDPPIREKPGPTYERRVPPRAVPGTDYLQIEARNRSLGLAGEKFVVTFEHQRLWKAGKKALAERVEHVAITRGDGLGYDVHSFDESGRDRLIEVKTTRFGAMTPFYVTRREVEASEIHQTYHLYRLFRFEQPQLYVVGGSLREHFELDPSHFKARIP